LFEWARELGVDLPEAAPAAPAIDAPGEPASETAEAPAASAPAADPLSRDDVLRSLLIKGSVTVDDLAATLLAQPGDAQAAVNELISEKLVESPHSGLRLTGESKLRALDAFSSDRGRVGETKAVEFLEGFHAFDLRVKEIVTAWQVRDVGGEQVFNDHTDPEYDAAILARLASLHDETVEWLAPLAGQLRRYAAYRSRLERALTSARTGDQRYVASPRVDSYHSVWFELHEDLIRLAGRRRSDESSAGRA
jgi:pyruvate, orthophosphate dikinase